MKKAIRRRYKIKQKKSIFKKPAFLWLFLFLFLLATAIYFLVFFEKFQINEIIISGNEKVQTRELERLVSEKIKQKLWFGVSFGASQSIFLVHSGKIETSILEQYPNIDTAVVKRKLPNALIINIKERKPSAVFCNDIECFFIDENGVIFEKTSGIRDDFPIVLAPPKPAGEGGRQTAGDLVLGKETVKKEIMESIINIKKDLEEKFQISVKEAALLSEERLNIKTNENWEIYLNLAADMDLQITKLDLLLEKEIPQESRAGLKYIDLRFERAYICYKNSPCSK